MSEPSLPEPLENFLQAPPSLPPDATLRECTWQRTAALVRRPRAWRRPAVVAAMAASIVIAIASAYVTFRHEPGKHFQTGVISVHESPPRPVEENPPEKPEAPAVIAKTNPLDLEWTAFDAADVRQRVCLYFQAGDAYLSKCNDYESAVRCYSQALDYCDARDLEFNPDDNWLVMALKRDHRKEK